MKALLYHYATFASRTFLELLQRFLSNQPRNEYESIAFGAVRLIAFTFGKRGAVSVVPG